MGRGVTWVVFSKLIGVAVFMLFLGFLNFLTRYISWNLFVSFTGFLNRNASLLIGVTLIFMVGELLSMMEFPSNVFGPVLNFIGAWMLLKFVFVFLESFQRRFDFGFLDNIFLLKSPIFITILSLIFVFGYLPIIFRLIKERGSEKEVVPLEKTEPVVIEKIKIVPKIVERVIIKEQFAKKKNKTKSKKK